jgi:hypothetical protein
MPKIAAQSAHTPLHLAFSVYAFGSDGRFLAWVGCDAQNRRRRPDPVEQLLDRMAGPAGLVGRRLSGVQASPAMVATPNETTTRPDLTESY